MKSDYETLSNVGNWVYLKLYLFCAESDRDSKIIGSLICCSWLSGNTFINLNLNLEIWDLNCKSHQTRVLGGGVGPEVEARRWQVTGTQVGPSPG